MNILPQASTFASRADQIFLVVFLISLVFLVGITGVMIYFVIRYSRKRHPTATQIEGHTGLEITWTVIPLVLFVAIFYFGWTNYDYSRRAPRDAMVVKVTGRQWNWTFQYPNGKQTTRLYAALRRPMKVEVVSADVLHGFSVPAFRLKMDAVPGRTNMTWFEPTLLGSFDVQCTVICGVDHSAMLTTVEVVSEDAFKAWYFGSEGTPEPSSAQNPPPKPPSAAIPSASATVSLTGSASPPPLDAVSVLKRNACLGCHSIDGEPMAGPTFKGIFGRRSPLVRHGVVEHVEMNEEQLTIAIIEPARDTVQGYPPMPTVQLTPDEIGRIVQYLKTLQ